MTEGLIERKGILDINRPLGEQWRENMNKILHYDWVFKKPIEKILIISAFTWGIYSIGKLIINIFWRVI